MKTFGELLVEALNKKPAFEEFAEKRFKGAKKIADNAKEKGGPSMLTYHHFVVKLPYYTKAENGKMDVEAFQKEYTQLVEQLASQKKNITMSMVEFQKLVGKIEVLGELILKSK
jgi:hypothetical protein